MGGVVIQTVCVSCTKPLHQPQSTLQWLDFASIPYQIALYDLAINRVTAPTFQPSPWP